MEYYVHIFQNLHHFAKIISSKSLLSPLFIGTIQDEIKEIVSPAFDRFSPSGLPAAAQPVGEYIALVSFTKWKQLFFQSLLLTTFFIHLLCISIIQCDNLFLILSKFLMCRAGPFFILPLHTLGVRPQFRCTRTPSSPLSQSS